MAKPIIEVHSISKKYRIGTRVQYYSLRDSIADVIKKSFHLKTKNNTRNNDTFWALKDVSFQVMPGEVLGIIGRNGAGKTTLFKILSQITLPTEGQIILRGRVASLLEVGTGFHPELSGRENIFLNGAILGMTRKEVKDKFDEIVDFAEIEKFLDTPVKHYSSGMYMRLAFAVAAHLEPEILLVDEVLAVGDIQFQKKCLQKMSTVSKQGRTVLFVSHNLSYINDLCRMAILIEKGKMIDMDSTPKVISKYLTGKNKANDSPRDLTDPKLRKNSSDGSLFRFNQIIVTNSKGETKTVIKLMDPFEIIFKGILKHKINDMSIALDVKSATGVLLFNSFMPRLDNVGGINTGELEFKVKFNPNLLGPGSYTIGLGARGNKIFDWIPEAITINIDLNSSEKNIKISPYYDGIIIYPCIWSVSTP